MALALAVGPLSAFADVPASPDPAAATDVKALIAQLGDAKFAARKSAGERLARIGLPAYQALEDATHDGDREVRYRAEKILSVIRQNDLNRRLTIFMASLESPEDPTLPSWPRFKAAYGNTTLTRTLFVEMQRAEGELLAQLEADPRKGTEGLGKRLAALTYEQDRTNRQGAPQQMPLGQLMAVYFVAGEPDVKPSSQTGLMLLRLGNQPALRSAAIPTSTTEKHATEKAAIIRKLLGTVIARSEDAAAQQAMSLAVQYDLKEGLTPALKVLEGQARVRFTIQYAMLLVAKFGNESHLPALEKLFTDNTLIATTSTKSVRREVQVRDSALAAAVLMTRQELKDYFDLPANLTAPGTTSTAYLMVGFLNDEERTAAFQKWEAFKAKTKAAEPKR
jgi:hypothetical protein